MLTQSTVLFASLLLARGTELAVVRPFSSKEEVHRLHESFDSWDALLPCGPHQRAATDLFLVYSKGFAAGGEVATEVAKVVAGFEHKDKRWHHCFRAVHVLTANLSDEDDVYDAQGQEENPKWVSGPNGVFRFLLRHFLSRHYQAFFLMELDAQPKRAYWLQQLEREVLDYPAVAIRGSQYRGDRWNAFWGTLPKAMRMHVNGNAIYFPGHPFLAWLNTHLQREADSIYNRIPYDVRMAQLMLDAESGKTPEFAEAWANFAPGGHVYASDSRLIGNYANTLLNISFDGGEFIAHGSRANVFDELDPGRLTLAVGHEDGQTAVEFEDMISAAVHPFRKVVVLLRSAVVGSSQRIELSTPRGLTEVHRTQAVHPGRVALCEAASHVETDFFVFMPAGHILRSPISVLVNDTKPVLPYLDVSSPLCTRSLCRESVLRAERRFNTSMRVHYDLRDTLFVTRLTREFCSAWSALQPNAAPSADDFMAWHKRRGSLQSSYSQVDRGVKGWRSWMAVNPVLAMRRLVASDELDPLNLTNDTNSTNGTNGTDSNTTCLYAAQGPCDSDPGCVWDPRFQSCSLFFEDSTTTTTSSATMMTSMTTTSNLTEYNTSGTETQTTTTTVMLTTTTLPVVTLVNGASVGRVVMAMNPGWVRLMLNRQCNNCYGKMVTGVARYLLDLSGGQGNKVRGVVSMRVFKRRCQLRLQREVLMMTQEAQLLFRWFLPRNCGAKIWLADRCFLVSRGFTFKRSLITLAAQRRLDQDPDLDLAPRLRGDSLEDSRGEPRLLQGNASAVDFEVAMDVEDAAELDEQVSMDNPGFLDGVGAELSALASANGISGLDIPGLTPTQVASPELSAEVTIQVLAEENANLNYPVLQAEALNSTALAAAIAQETGISDFVANATVDLCAGRDCSGRGTCIGGICQCQPGWSQPNCRESLFTVTVTTTQRAATLPPTVPEEDDNGAVIVIVVFSVLTVLLLLLLCLFLYFKPAALPPPPLPPPEEDPGRTFI